MPAKILISTTTFATYDASPLELLKTSGLQALLNPLQRTLKPEEILQHAAGCAGILAGTEPYSADTLARLKGLKVISRCGAGLDSIDLPAAEKLGIQVACTPFGPTRAVAELTVGLILNLLRDITLSDARLKRGSWEKPMGFLVGEMTFGILGLGRIGRQVALLLKQWGANVIGHDIRPDRAWANQHGILLQETEIILKTADVVCLHLSYDKSLHHVMGKEELAMMKKGSYLINVSRGGLVDEMALQEALKSGHLRGAALDVFEQEPYQGPLKGLENIILTPHIGSYARNSRIAMEREAVENLIGALRQCNVLSSIEK
jgi:D-3-phosphoglycerate dehydrogenase